MPDFEKSVTREQGGTVKRQRLPAGASTAKRFAVDILTNRENKRRTNRSSPMSLSEKFIVLPFKKNRGNIVPGEMRQASSAASAEKIATAMSARHLGVAAYSIQVDEESGDMNSPKLIIAFGETADLTVN